MSEFKFEEAVTQAFRTSGGKLFGWRLVFWTAAALTIVHLILLPLILPYYGDLMAANQQNLQSILHGTETDPSRSYEFLQKIPVAYFFLMAGYWTVWVACESAFHRKVLHGHEMPKQPLRLGLQELRVWLIQVRVFGALFAIYFFGFLTVIAFGGLMLLPLLCLLILASVRFAPATALFVKGSKAPIRGATKITTGRFWILLGTYLPVFIGGYMLLNIIMVMGVGLVTGDSNFLMTMSGLGEDNPKEAMAVASERLKNPLVMLMGILSMITYCAGYALWMVSLIGVSSHAAKVWGKS